MKSLKQYIKEDFSHELLSHLIVEFQEFSLMESAGIPTGLEEDSKVIAEKIRKYIIQNPKEFSFTLYFSRLKMLPDVNFVINVLRDGTKFSSGLVDWKKTTEKEYVLETTVPNVKGCFLSFRDIASSVGHELLHCYVYFKNISSGSTTLPDRMSKINYNKYFSGKTSLEEQVKAFMYYTTLEEVNAFIAQVVVEIDKENIKSVQDAQQCLENNLLYKLYNERIFTFLDNYKESLPEICNIWRNLIETDKNYSDKEITRKIKRRIQYIKERFNRILPRLFYENYSKVKVMDGQGMKENLLKLRK